MFVIDGKMDWDAEIVAGDCFFVYDVTAVVFQLYQILSYFICH